MPRHRSAQSLKVISGTERKDRAVVPAVELPTVEKCPPAPDWLPNAHAVKEWDRLGPILVANKLLTDGGLTAFGQLCALHGKLVQLWAAGESPNASMIGQYRNLINDFGLTPVAQGKVKALPSDQPQGNAFASNGRKPQQATG